MRCLGEVTGTEIRGPHRLQRNSSQQKQQSWVLWTFSRFFSTEQPGSEEGRGALQSRWADSRAFHQDRRPPGRGPIQVTWCLRAGFAVLASPGPALSWKLICHGSSVRALPPPELCISNKDQRCPGSFSATGAQSGRYPHPSSVFPTRTSAVLEAHLPRELSQGATPTRALRFNKDRTPVTAVGRSQRRQISLYRLSAW